MKRSSVLHQAQALGLLLVTAVVLLGLSYATSQVTGLPGAVSFIAVGMIGLGVVHYHRTYREVPPRKNSPYTSYRLSFDGWRRYTTGSKKLFVEECLCSRVKIWMLPNGHFRLEMRIDLIRDGTSYGFFRELTMDADLLMLLGACQRLESLHGQLAAMPVDCLFDDDGNIHGIIVGSEPDGEVNAYMW